MKKFWHKLDKPLLILTIIFSLFGLVMVFSASSIISSFSETKTPIHFVGRQAVFVAVGYFFGAIILKLTKPISKHKNLVIFGGFAFLIALGLLFVLGNEVNNAKSWYDFKLFSIQPSEFLKVYIPIYLGYFFEKLRWKKEKNGKEIYRPIIYLTICLILILLQPDLGATVIMIFIIASIIIYAPKDPNTKKTVFKLFLIAIVGIGIFFSTGLYKKVINKRQLSRFTFQKPCERYEQSTGYQLCNSFIAINNGGLKGVGLGNSTQKYLYLPAAHTDFIFPIIIEELGSIVGTIVIICYIFLIRRLYLIAKKSTNVTNSVIAFGIMITFTIQVLVNLTGVLGILPLTGVPLPFLSHGGSFTLTTYIMVFLAQKIAVETYDNEYKNQLNKSIK